MGRTKKNIELKIPEKPRKIKGFRNGGYRIATTISSQGRYDHFDTYPWTRFTNARMIITNPAKKIKYDGGISANSVV